MVVRNIPRSEWIPSRAGGTPTNDVHPLLLESHQPGKLGFDGRTCRDGGAGDRLEEDVMGRYGSARACPALTKLNKMTKHRGSRPSRVPQHFSTPSRLAGGGVAGAANHSPHHVLVGGSSAAAPKRVEADGARRPLAPRLAWSDRHRFWRSARGVLRGARRVVSDAPPPPPTHVTTSQPGIRSQRSSFLRRRPRPCRGDELGVELAHAPRRRRPEQAGSATARCACGWGERRRLDRAQRSSQSAGSSGSSR